MASSRTSRRPDPARRAVVIGLGLSLASSPTKAACPPLRVLFVCPAGTVKSAIAREALKRRAAADGVSLSVSSRGVHPEDHVSPGLAARLKADGLDPASEPLRRLTQADIAEADIAVAFDAAADEPLLNSARAWKTPSWNGDYPAAKADLDDRLALLLVEIKARAARPCGAP